MATAPNRHFVLPILARVVVFALIFLLASEVAAIRPIRIQEWQSAAQIVRTTVSIDASPQPEAIEGQPLRFIVRRSRALRERTAISYRLENMAQFQRALPTVVIDAGQTMAEILVPTVDDTMLNGDRNVVVTLTGASGTAVLGNAQATGIIRDNERPPVPTADIEAAPAPSVVEGETLQFTIRLRAAVNSRTAIRYEILDNAGVINAAGQGRIIIPAGSTEMPLRIPTRDDDIVNGERTVQVRLTAISSDGKIGIAQGQGIVLDNDKAPITPRISVLSNGNAVEGEELTFTVFADSAVQNSQRIPIQISAPEGALIEPIPSTVLLRAGDTSTLLTLLTADDTALTDARSVTIALVASEGVIVDPSQANASGLINDNDKPPLPVQNDPPDNSEGSPDTPKPVPVGGFGATLLQGPVPVIVAAILLAIAGFAGVRRFILPRFYKVGWTMGLPHYVGAESSNGVIVLPPGGGVEIEMGLGAAAIVGPCPILSEEERDDPDEHD